MARVFKLRGIFDKEETAFIKNRIKEIDAANAEKRKGFKLPTSIGRGEFIKRGGFDEALNNLGGDDTESVHLVAEDEKDMARRKKSRIKSRPSGKTLLTTKTSTKTGSRLKNLLGV